MKNNISMYIYRENAIPFEICDDVVRYQDTFDWQTHQWYSEGREGGMSYDEKELQVAYPDENLSEILGNYTSRVLNNYHDHVHEENPIVVHQSEPRLNLYQTGTMMRPHFDHIKTLFDGETQGIPVLSIVGLFNDDFVGGEFVFWDDYVVRMNKGDVIVFPSNFMYKHRVNEVISGSRMSYVSWAW